MELTLPYNFKPRDYQLPVFRAMDSGFGRAVLLWHRRAGKDLTVFNVMVKKMMERVGIYYYFFPTYAQGRKILWDGMDKSGRRFLDYVPKQLFAEEPNNTFMKFRLKNGSLFQIVGTDNIDDIVGTNPVGCAFSEYSLQDPRAWDFIRPILRENGGWAIFDYTPRGMNHGYDLYEMARNNPEWFVSRLTADDTKAISREAIEEERKAGMPEEMAQQEYYCSFEAALVGSYYGKCVADAASAGRIGTVPHDPSLAVHTFWDLGMDDATSIVFAQRFGKEWRAIDYEEESGEGLAFYAGLLDRKRQELGYRFGTHNAPHDIAVRELGTGKSRLETARAYGINFRTIPRWKVEDGINAVRQMFPSLWIDGTRCKRLIQAAKEYSKEWDEERKCFSMRPKHDWTSHPMDALRTMAVASRGLEHYEDVADVAPVEWVAPTY